MKKFHRKWPTPEQFKEEYGESYKEDGAVWCKHINASKWHLCEFGFALATNDDDRDVIICACTPWGKPPDDWIP